MFEVLSPAENHPFAVRINAVGVIFVNYHFFGFFGGRFVFLPWLGV